MGSRASCLYRQSVVVVTGWTEARIPWPRCRGPFGGGVGLLVDDELARAIQRESVLAVCYWWGVSRSALRFWRKAFGVRRMDSEGSRRLILGAVQQGLEARYDERPRKKGGRGRVIAGVVPAPDLGLLWTPEEVAPLGVLPDDEVAKKVGRTENAVRCMREELNRPDPTDPERLRRHRPWAPEEDALLTRLPAREVAARTGHPIGSVHQRRHKLGLTGQPLEGGE
jgi:hypothetical protein